MSPTVLKPPLWILTIEEQGMQYIVRRESDGESCLCVWTSKDALVDFLARKELPRYKNYSTQKITDAASVTGLAVAVELVGIQYFAVDPITDFEFACLEVEQVRQQLE